MKRLALALSMLTLCACSAEVVPESEDPVPSPPKTSYPVIEQTQKIKILRDKKLKNYKDHTYALEKIISSVPVSTLLAEDEGVTITLQELAYDSSDTLYLGLKLENYTDQDLYFTPYLCAINGYMQEPVMGLSLPSYSETAAYVLCSSVKEKASVLELGFQVYYDELFSSYARFLPTTVSLADYTPVDITAEPVYEDNYLRAYQLDATSVLLENLYTEAITVSCVEPYVYSAITPGNRSEVYITEAEEITLQISSLPDNILLQTTPSISLTSTVDVVELE